MKGDFTQKYKTIADIFRDEKLTVDEQLREQVKHHSMCLFTLACDLANQQKKYLQKEDDLKNRVLEYKALIERLRLAVQVRDERIEKLQRKLKRYATESPKSQPKLPKRIPLEQLTDEQKIAVQSEYYQRRITTLETKVKYWREKANKGANNGK